MWGLLNESSESLRTFSESSHNLVRNVRTFWGLHKESPNFRAQHNKDFVRTPWGVWGLFLKELSGLDQTRTPRGLFYAYKTMCAPGFELATLVMSRASIPACSSWAISIHLISVEICHHDQSMYAHHNIPGDIGTSRCTRLRRFQIWKPHVCTCPN